MNKAIQKAADRVGGVQELAKMLGVSWQAVYHWRSGYQKIAPKRVLLVEALTGVSRYELRPDIYGPAPPTVRPAEAQEVSQ